jgi:hypothetical protein
VRTKADKQTYASEANGGIADATLLNVAYTHDVLVHSAGDAVVVLRVQLRDGVNCNLNEKHKY